VGAAVGPRTLRRVGDRPTLRDVAAAAGVSRSTASNAYSRPDQLSRTVRDRVLAAAVELGYPGPSPTGSALRRGHTGALAVLLGDRLGYAFSDPAAVLTLDGLASAVEPAGTALLVLPGAARASGPAPDGVRRAVVDAVVAYSLSDDDPAVAAVRSRGLPLVAIDQPRLSGVPAVVVDDAGGARSAAEHLLGLGHRRIAVAALELATDEVTGLADQERQSATRFPVTADRLAGYRTTVEAAGLDWAAVPVHECARNTREEGAAAFAALRPHRPTAILAMSDELALGVLRAATAAGLRMPEDVAVVGFDDTPAAQRAGLSSVRQPLYDKGWHAGRQVLALLAGAPIDPVTLSTELVVRRSTDTTQ
jgi:DNA-binding LacI/PurR family transcriptional regulator